MTTSRNYVNNALFTLFIDDFEYVSYTKHFSDHFRNFVLNFQCIFDRSIIHLIQGIPN